MNVTGIDKLAKYASQKSLFKLDCNRLLRKDMQKRNRVASLLALPFVVFIWLIGWCMCLTGEKKGNRQNKNLKIR